MLKNSHVSGSSIVMPMRYRFDFGEAKIPQPEKAHKGGEDACFADDNIIVVADGVGGWAQHGVDSSLYSNRLCQLVRDYFYSKPYAYVANPRQLIADAVAANTELGSATVTLLTLEPTTGLIRSAYLGDSVFSLFRATPFHGYAEHYCAQEQQRAFNQPYQVGTHGDNPEQCVCDVQQALPQDLVVVGSDGLWDNLYHNELTAQVNQHWSHPKLLASSLANSSFAYSLTNNYRSPFCEKAARAGLCIPTQGKSDDITVVAARVIIDYL